MESRCARRPSATAVLAIAASLLGVPSAARAAECPLTAEDAQAIRGVQDAYRSAWLEGDMKGVLATLTEDAILLPAHGAAPIQGREAIVRSWWPPDAPPTTVTQLDISVEGLAGDCRLAFAHGHDNVKWSVREKGETREHGHPGTYLNVFTKGSDGRWRIARHMWDDGRSD